VADEGTGFPQSSGGSIILPHVPSSPNGPYSPSGWQTLLVDDFLGNALNQVLWFPGGVYTGNSPNTMGFSHSGTPPNPLGTYALNTPQNISVANSCLVLQMIPQVITGDPTVSGTPTNYQWTTATVSSQAQASTGTTGFTFPVSSRVVMEASIKVPADGTSIWPAFWASSAGVYILEVDVFEMYGTMTKPQSNMHYVPNGGTYASAQLGPNIPAAFPDLSAAFHTYTADINWDGNGSVSYYLDGVLLVTFTCPNYGSSSYGWGIGQTALMQLIIDIQLQTASPTNLPAYMFTDWVHVLAPN
jgi:hypothetical protein